MPEPEPTPAPTPAVELLTESEMRELEDEELDAYERTWAETNEYGWVPDQPEPARVPSMRVASVRIPSSRIPSRMRSQKFDNVLQSIIDQLALDDVDVDDEIDKLIASQDIQPAPQPALVQTRANSPLPNLNYVKSMITRLEDQPWFCARPTGCTSRLFSGFSNVFFSGT
jgi:hypothetical protein